MKSFLRVVCIVLIVVLVFSIDFAQAGSYAKGFDNYGKSLLKGIAMLLNGSFGWIAFFLMVLVGCYEYFFGKRDATTLTITVIGIVILCIIAGSVKRFSDKTTSSGVFEKTEIHYCMTDLSTAKQLIVVSTA